MLSAIPYHTFPQLPGGFYTFGLLVGIGIAVGATVAKRHVDAHGADGEALYSFAWVAAIVGVLGARLLWVVGNWSDYAADPLSVLFIWEGGLSFTGGFIAVAAVTPFWLRRHAEIPGRVFADGVALGLVVGQWFGRWGCIMVGEHFGGETNFFLAVRYTGGGLAEPFLENVPGGPVRIVEGMTFHNAALYEMLFLTLLIPLLFWLRSRRPPDGVVACAAGIGYAIGRFVSDIFRVNDERLWGLTGAQYACIVLLGVSVWFLRAFLADRRYSLPDPDLAVAPDGAGDADADADTPDTPSDTVSDTDSDTADAPIVTDATTGRQRPGSERTDA